MPGNVWNPNAPTTAGLEWFPTLRTDQLIDSIASGVKLRSRSAETIDAIRVAIAETEDFPGSSYGILHADVYSAATPPAAEPGGGATTVTFTPNATTATGRWFNSAGTQVNLHTYIDDTALGGPDYIFVDGGYGTFDGSGGEEAIFEFNTASLPADARILKIVLKVNAQEQGFALEGQWNPAVHNVGAATRWAPEIIPVAVTPEQTYSWDLGELNPTTLQTWIPSQVQGFDSGTWRIGLQSYGGMNSTLAIYSMWIEVTYVTETRLATGAYFRGQVTPMSTAELRTIQLITLPGGADNWSKANATDYIVMLRSGRRDYANPVSDGVRFAPPSHFTALTSYATTAGGTVTTAPPVPGMLGYTQVMTALTAPSGDLTVNNRLPVVALVTTAPAVSEDSQPYRIAKNTDTPAAKVTNTQVWAQLITAPATANFLVVRALVRPVGDPVQGLTATIKRNSDNVVMGAAATLTDDDVEALPDVGGGWRIATWVLPSPAALVSATLYRVELSTTDTEGYYVQTALGTTVTGGPATYGGTTDARRNVTGAVTATDSDLPLTIAQQPAAPATGSASVVSVDLPGDVARACGVDSYDKVRVEFGTTALGVSWLRYEIERTEDGGTTWQPIGWVTSSEAASFFDDYEGRRGVQAGYRVRVVRIDGAFSPWTATVIATPQPRGCEMLFVSNEDPTLAVGYEHDPTLEYAFLSPGTDVLVPIYGRDFQVAFMEAENRGLSFPVGLIVNFKDDPANVGIGEGASAFVPLRTVSRAAISYVAVLDQYGQRFLAHVQIDGGTIRQPGNRYTASARITEVADEPSIALR